jgi:hypothetical protein
VRIPNNESFFLNIIIFIGISFLLLLSCSGSNQNMPIESVEYDIYSRIIDNYFNDHDVIDIFNMTLGKKLQILKEDIISDKQILDFDNIFNEISTNLNFKNQDPSLIELNKIKISKKITLTLTRNINSIMFSRVGFNKKKDFGILYYHNNQNSLAGSGYILLVALNKNNGKWDIISSKRIWIS